MALRTSGPATRRFASLAVPVIAALALGLGGGSATAMADTPTGQPRPTRDTVTAGEVTRGSLLGEVRRELAAARHTHYQHPTEVDEQSGEFDYDCSGFLDYALQRIDPAAYRALPVSKTRPLAQDVVHQIRSGKPGPWQQVATAAQLRPGDVVSWLTPQDSDSDNTGHVMIVLATPTENARRDNEWLVQVADSTTSPHAADSRIGGSPNGLGTGTIGLVADDTGQPVGYYWRGGVSTELKHTVVALGQVN
jgi:hypothetical protein